MEKEKIIKTSISLLIEVLLVILGIYGIYLNFGGSGFMGNGSMMLYFTIQSNITIIVITFIFFILKIFELIIKKDLIKNYLRLIKYVFTVAITITFLVFFVLLAPTLDTSYLLSMNNLTVHFLVPLLALIDFFTFDNEIKFNKWNPLLGLIFPLLYLGFVFICIASNISFNGQLVPYFFLDYETLTWFNITEKGIGVFYYIIILLIFVILLCYLFYGIIYLINKVKNKYFKKENN